jgi:hypothetical protein
MLVVGVLGEAVTATIFLVTNPWFRRHLRSLSVFTNSKNVTSFLVAHLAAALQ